MTRKQKTRSRLTKTVIDCYLDGATGAGLFRRLGLPYRELEGLEREDERIREFQFAYSSLLTGGIASAIGIAAYVYFAVHDRPVFAGCIMALGVSQIILRFIRARIRAEN